MNFLSEGVRISEDALYMNPALCLHYSAVIMAIVGVGCSKNKNASPKWYTHLDMYIFTRPPHATCLNKK